MHPLSYTKNLLAGYFTGIHQIYSFGAVGHKD